MNMAKRKNPYIEDIVPQSKVHIGMKQFNNNEDRLKKVYEKTLLLLFKGAKNGHQVTTVKESGLNLTDKSDKMKQLTLGKNGALLRSGNMLNNKSGARQCSCGVMGEVQCAYCEVSLCGGCQHNCACCQCTYCLNCTITQLEGAEVCVSCYS